MNNKVTCYLHKKAYIIDDVFMYDDDEPSNCEAWKRLPSFYQSYLVEKHTELREYVSKKLTNYKFLVTSGFRSFSVNKNAGGVSDSLHLHGLAIDIIVLDKYNNILSDQYESIKNLLNSDKYTCINEKTHLHLQFNRRK